ncbi:hypothetical protein Daus18300_009511 [Diaporthe australafricana]|uniref:Transcription regulator Rua1 C-terminal domain-containing protein n=1 Tax=Diaporthe australafricana TaxID=127596 RepID=A0ABR3WE73_9PEZI
MPHGQTAATPIGFLDPQCDDVFSSHFLRSAQDPDPSTPGRSTSAAASLSSSSSCASKSSQRSWDEDDEFDQVLHAIRKDLDEHIKLLKVSRFTTLFTRNGGSRRGIRNDARRELKRLRLNVERKLGEFGGARNSMLQGNADSQSSHDYHTYLSDPPDLYASLREGQRSPPPEDMNPLDPEQIPLQQELRFDGDLYTSKWVRGHGNKREGWCGICKPGRWLKLKNPDFGHDRSFCHGINWANGQPFIGPQVIRRMDGNPGLWEGFCDTCKNWIALRKESMSWFLHAYECHVHPEIGNEPERRIISRVVEGRELRDAKLMAAAQVSAMLDFSQSGMT